MYTIKIKEKINSRLTVNSILKSESKNKLEKEIYFDTFEEAWKKYVELVESAKSESPFKSAISWKVDVGNYSADLVVDDSSDYYYCKVTVSYNEAYDEDDLYEGGIMFKNKEITYAIEK